MTARTITLPADHDGDTLAAAGSEINAYLEYEEQTGRLDDRTREAFVIALELLTDATHAYRKEQ